MMSMLPLLLAAALIILTTAFLRLLYILPPFNPTRPSPRKRGTATRLLVVLGSGGHTAEMLAMLRNIDTTLYTHRSYVVSEGDAFSRQKALEFEAQLADRNPSPATARGQTNGRPVDEVPPSYDIVTIPRARKIHQSLLTTPISAFHCLAACFRVLYSPASSPSQPGYPDLIVTNGPGTAVCVILACLITRFFGLRGSAGRMRTIYVESWARVRRLSLSGKILIRCVDRFLVQWQGLRGVAGRAEFIGVLV